MGVASVRPTNFVLWLPGVGRKLWADSYSLTFGTNKICVAAGADPDFFAGVDRIELEVRVTLRWVKWLKSIRESLGKVRTMPLVFSPDVLVYAPGFVTALGHTLIVGHQAVSGLTWRSSGRWVEVRHAGWSLAENPFDRQALACMVDDALDRGQDETPYREALSLLEKYP